ncbi:hypothetical protein SDC9_117592 [bioreactor metagenome]|jgi:hypothetical protein|uniref:Uncharacterized protein n=2 Tax=root TaxID=1 RepID=A0A645BZY7_9ZZZZ
MLAGTMNKFLFRIRTRNGVVVDHLSFYGRDEDEARRKVAQIYNHCEVLECTQRRVSMNGRLGTVNYESLALPLSLS